MKKDLGTQSLLILSVLLTAVLTLVGCGTTATTTTIVVTNNPVPAITTLLPTSAASGTQAFTLTVNGAGFVSGAVVRWNGAERPTTFASGTQLTAAIPATDVATAGSVSITVVNPTPGGGTSAAVTFSIVDLNPVPAITGLSPSVVAAGSAAFTLTVRGTGFVKSSVVRFIGYDRTTTYVSATELQAAMTAADVANVMVGGVTVSNPAPGGGSSGSSLLTVVAGPTISSMAPTSVSSGTSQFYLLVNGRNFTTSSVVRWNGSDRVTIFNNGTSLQAIIPASDVAIAGTAAVTVFDSGFTSNASTFTIADVVAMTITPDSIYLAQGETQQFGVTVIGTSDPRVSWSIQEGAAGGTITATGLYTAPASWTTAHVVATSLADPSKSVSAEIYVEQVGLYTMPYRVALAPGGTVQFTAQVWGTVLNTDVTWQVPDGAAAGTVTAAGLYTAPNAGGGPFRVTATSQADPTKTSESSVWVDTSSFQPAAAMTAARQFHSATLLGNGDVLLAGGGSATTELYDHVLATFRPLGTMLENRSAHTATLLANGKVLITGGGIPTTANYWSCGGVSHKSTELHDPATGLAASDASMSEARAFHTATLLSDGRVLIAGGLDLATCTSSKSMEIYDPQTKQFSAAGNMSVGRYLHTATLLPNGTVLLAGGEGDYYLRFSGDVYDPATGRIATSIIFPRSRNGHTATLLPYSPGSVLLAGGGVVGSYLYSQSRILSSNGMVSNDIALVEPRMLHTATLLGNDKVLLAGGIASVGSDLADGTATNSAEFFEDGMLFRPTLSMSVPRVGHAATLLQDGRVLITGGTNDKSAEIYGP